MNNSAPSSASLNQLATTLEVQVEGIEQLELCPLKTFHLFPLFPKEIRDSIWKHALPCSRIIEVAAGDVRGDVRVDGLLDDELSPYPARYCQVYEVHKDLIPRKPTEEDKWKLTPGLSDTHWEAGHGELRLKISNGNRSDRVPGMLSACRESRIITMEAFEFCLSITPDPSITFSKWDNLPSLETAEVPVFIPPEEMGTRGVRFQPRRDTIYWKNESGMTRLYRRTIPAEILTSNIRSVAVLFDLFLWNLCERIFVGEGDAPMFRGVEELFILDDEGHLLAQECEWFEEQIMKMLQELEWTSPSRAAPTVRIVGTKDFLDLPRWGSSC